MIIETNDTKIKLDKEIYNYSPVLQIMMESIESLNNQETLNTQEYTISLKQFNSKYLNFVFDYYKNHNFKEPIQINNSLLNEYLNTELYCIHDNLFKNNSICIYKSSNSFNSLISINNYSDINRKIENSTYKIVTIPFLDSELDILKSLSLDNLLEIISIIDFFNFFEIKVSIGNYMNQYFQSI